MMMHILNPVDTEYFINNHLFNDRYKNSISTTTYTSLSSERIVSFLPSSTEILYEIGAGSQIVGVTHECKYPDDAKRKPRVINASFYANKMNSKQIDQKIIELIRSGTDIYVINDEKLREAKPDLIIAQGICEVCAPFAKEIDRAVSILGYRPDTLVLDPHDLDDILTSIMDIAERVNRVTEGRKLVVSLQKRIDSIRMRSGRRIGGDEGKKKNNNNN